MAGFENSIVFSNGEKLQPSSASDISSMQELSTDVSRVNYVGSPEGNVSANPSSLSHDPTNGDIWFKASGTGNTGWLKLGNSTGSIIITKFETPGSHTWTKNASSKMVSIMAWGGGSGGGSGARYAVGQNPGGGGGGAGVGCIQFECFASTLDNTETVVVGAGGTGGAAVTVNDTDGNNGLPGGGSSFGKISTINESVFTYSPNPTYGQGGQNASVFFGGNSGPIITNSAITVAQTAGGLGGLGAGPGNGSNVPSLSLIGANSPNPSYLSNMAGGGGGGIDNITFDSTGGNGGSYVLGSDGSTLFAGGAGGVAGVNSGNGSNGLDGGVTVTGGILFSGTGGGGGASAAGVAGGNGGNGGKYGGGGGGGAASNNGFNSGAGGNGGDGAVIVIEYLNV